MGGDVRLLRRYDCPSGPPAKYYAYRVAVCDYTCCTSFFRLHMCREEHEDLLLHEVLLCLKGLCTTGQALERLEKLQATLFPELLKMLFNDEKKGPSEYSTRAIIISLLCALIISIQPTRALTTFSHTFIFCHARRAADTSHWSSLSSCRPTAIRGRRTSKLHCRDAAEAAISTMVSRGHQRYEGSVLDISAPSKRHPHQPCS